MSNDLSAERQHWQHVADWSAFFDSLASDEERRVAAHVMEALAPYDLATESVCADSDFHSAYIGPARDRVEEEVTV